jgi:hypothetical protein
MIVLRSSINAFTSPTFYHPAQGAQGSASYVIPHNLYSIPDEVVLYYAGDHTQVIDHFFGQDVVGHWFHQGYQITSLTNTSATITIWNLGGSYLYAKFIKYVDQHIIPS